MSVQILKKQKEKISPEFFDKLNRLDPKQKIRIVVMLYTSEMGKKSRHQPRAERKKAMESILEASKKAIPEIDAILNRYGGEKWASAPDVLGCLPLETTVSGVNALTSLKEVKAVLEDQPISLIH